MEEEIFLFGFNYLLTIWNSNVSLGLLKIFSSSMRGNPLWGFEPYVFCSGCWGTWWRCSWHRPPTRGSCSARATAHSAGSIRFDFISENILMIWSSLKIELSGKHLQEPFSVIEDQSLKWNKVGSGPRSLFFGLDCVFPLCCTGSPQPKVIAPWNKLK